MTGIPLLQGSRDPVQHCRNLGCGDLWLLHPISGYNILTSWHLWAIWPLHLDVHPRNQNCFIKKLIKHHQNERCSHPQIDGKATPFSYSIVIYFYIYFWRWLYSIYMRIGIYPHSFIIAGWGFYVRNHQCMPRNLPTPGQWEHQNLGKHTRRLWGDPNNTRFVMIWEKP